MKGTAQAQCWRSSKKRKRSAKRNYNLRCAWAYIDGGGGGAQRQQVWTPPAFGFAAMAFVGLAAAKRGR